MCGYIFVRHTCIVCRLYCITLDCGFYFVLNKTRKYTSLFETASIRVASVFAYAFGNVTYDYVPARMCTFVCSHKIRQQEHTQRQHSRTKKPTNQLTTTAISATQTTHPRTCKVTTKLGTPHTNNNNNHNIDN